MFPDVEAPTYKFEDTHQVYVNEEGVWDAMLNQTDVSAGQNKNKFGTSLFNISRSLMLPIFQVLRSPTSASHQQQFSVATIHSLGKSR